MMRKVIAVGLLGGFSFIALVFCLFCSARTLSLYKYSSSDFVWAQTIGEIQISRVNKHLKAKPDQKYHKVRYSYDILYEYEVDGQFYKSKKVALGGIDSSEFGCQVLAEKYNTGNNVIVYYDEAHPALAVLDIDSANGGGSIVLAVIAVASGIAALLSFSFILKNFFKKLRGG